MKLRNKIEPEKKKIVVLREQDKHFLWSLLAAFGVIFVWKGLWEGLYEIPYISNPWVALFIGFAMLTLSGMIFREFDPLGSIDKSITKTLQYITNHPRRHEFEIGYTDKFKKNPIRVNAGKIRHFEKGSLVINDKNNQEVFIPAHRVVEVLHKGETYLRI